MFSSFRFQTSKANLFVAINCEFKDQFAFEIWKLAKFSRNSADPFPIHRVGEGRDKKTGNRAVNES